MSASQVFFSVSLPITLPKILRNNLKRNIFDKNFSMEILNYLSSAARALLPNSVDNSDRYTTPPNFSINPLYNPGEAEWELIDGREREVYETTGTLSVVIDRKAQLESVGRYRHWKGSKNTTEDIELFNTPELNLLYNPNPLQSKDDFLKEWSINKSVMGVNYTFGNKGSRLNPVPKVIWNIQPELLQAKTKANIWRAETLEDIFQYYEVINTGERIEPFELLRRALPNPKNQLRALSPLTKIRQEISNARLAMQYRNIIMGKRGALGILSGDQRDGDGTKPMDKNEFERIENEYRNSWGVYQKQMKILMARYPMKWTPMSFPTKDLMLFEEVDSNSRKFIDNYGMVEELFSFTKGATISESGGKMYQAEQQVYNGTIIPEKEDDMNALSKWLGLHKKGEYITLDYSHVPAMQDNEEVGAKIKSMEIASFVALMGLENGVSRDEALALCGLKGD